MKKHEILFIHGGGDGAHRSDQQLALSLQQELSEDYIVHYPQMPGETDPHYEAYKPAIGEGLHNIAGPVILVGHSVGSCFLLKYLSEEKIEKEIIGIFLLATPFWGEGGWQYEGFGLVKDYVSKLPAVPIFFYHGNKDETVPFTHLALYRKQIPRAAFREIAGAGHQFNNDLSAVAKDITAVTKSKQ